ncbi:hypothetical protein [Bacillus subtilis]|uniref:hypothetical protein n=1 Tax=Bacillus subtilis TaxID=1423 RepID=UPI001B904D85|nr:hypothetical protein [Bacillus subtilis]CAF1786146.1 hypothetical protein NRS6108_04237 [Bacillus subtilis]
MAEQVNEMFVYEYQHLDDLSFIKPIEEHFKDSPNEGPNEEFIDELKQLFRSCGWEGDGQLGVIWLPPFVEIGHEDTWGNYIYHVKQYNNGISFLASSYQLPFARLLSQNEIELDSVKYMMPLRTPNYFNETLNIIEPNVDWFKRNINKYRESLIKELQAIQSIPGELNDELTEKILGYNQGMIVQLLNGFIDSCYLNILMEVLSDGNNSNLKLSKSSAKIDLSRHDEMTGEWLTIQMIIGDIWKSYKFEGFKDKLAKLIKPFNYKINSNIKKTILKHVLIRNCIQHHNWGLDSSSLIQMQIGESIEILKEDNTTIEIQKERKIVLTKEEVIKLIDDLIIFADTFSSCVSSRVATRY